MVVLHRNVLLRHAETASQSIREALSNAYSPRFWQSTRSRFRSSTVFGGRRPNAEDLRTNANAGGGLAEERTDGCHRQGGHLRGVRRRQTRSPKHLARTVHDLYFEPKYEQFQSRTIWSFSCAFTSAFKELDRSLNSSLRPSWANSWKPNSRNRSSLPLHFHRTLHRLTKKPGFHLSFAAL